MGPERRFRLRLSTRSSVKPLRGPKEPVRSRFSRTSRETLFLRHETPFQEQGLEVEFQLVSLFPLSDAALNAIKASKSWFKEAQRHTKWSKQTQKAKCACREDAAIVAARKQREIGEDENRKIKGFRGRGKKDVVSSTARGRRVTAMEMMVV